MVEIPDDNLNPPDGRPLYPSTCESYKLTDAVNLNFFGITGSGIDIMPGPPEQILKFFPQVYTNTKFKLSYFIHTW